MNGDFLKGGYDMKYQEFQGLSVSALVLGVMRLPKTAEGKIDREASRKIVEAALKDRINHVNTANE